MRVYAVTSSDWESHSILSIWTSPELAETEISRLRRTKYNGRLLYPKRGSTSLGIEIFELDKKDGMAYV